MQVQTQKSNPALRYGLLFGIILGAIEFVLYLALANIGFLIALLFYLGLVGFAGYRASARTGKVSTGLVAGLLAGLFSSVIASIATFFFLLPHIDTLRQLLQQQASTLNQGNSITYTNTLVTEGLIVALIIVVVISTVVALGIGALGGAIGKGNAPVQQPPYPPYPYGGQYQDPRYMPPPAYPPQENVPPRMYTPPPPSPQNYNTPSPQKYPPSPEDYMSPPPQENKHDGA